MSFMKTMMSKWTVLFCIVAVMFALNASYVSADTNGTELQVVKAETLEVQLGEEWTGVQFQLMTDAGIYPEKISVDDDGILRLELGGSSKYTLSCLNSATAVSEETEKNDEVKCSGKSNKSEETEQKNALQNTKTVAGIPIMHIVLFAGGMLIAVTILLILHQVTQGKDGEEDDEEDC